MRHNHNLGSAPDVIAIVLARLDSSRLPGKALKKIEGRSLISYCVERVRRVKGIRRVVLATTTRPEDDPLVEFAQDAGIDVFRGSLANVAERCLECAQSYEAEYFLRVNGDSPFIDPSVIEAGINLLSADRPDFVSNLIERTYPYGIAVELVKTAVMARFLPEVTPEQLEHVTKVFYDCGDSLARRSLPAARQNLSSLRMVVDDAEDLARFEQVAAALGAQVIDAGYEQVAEIYRALSW